IIDIYAELETQIILNIADYLVRNYDDPISVKKIYNQNKQLITDNTVNLKALIKKAVEQTIDKKLAKDEATYLKAIKKGLIKKVRESGLNSLINAHTNIIYGEFD